MKIAGGLTQDGVVVGNAYDKYGSRNPIVRWMMRGFGSALDELVAKANPRSIHEIGCGEGYWVVRWNERGLAARGCDFSAQVIELARENAIGRQLPPTLFRTRSVYELDAIEDRADLVVCCEVLEHLNDPDAALQVLEQIVDRHLILSVPREPLWRLLNAARGKYLADFGNTPGHIQHWSRRSFIRMVSDHFEVIEERHPLPWTMLLCRPRRRLDATLVSG